MTEESEHRTRRVTVLLTEEEYQRVRRAAYMEELSRSEWGGRVMLDAIERFRGKRLSRDR
jgi:hypothetical protein